MKYKEITIYTDSPSALAEELSAAGYAQLIINDPAELEMLEKESWGYTGSYVDRMFLDELRKNSSVTFYIGENEALLSEAQELIKQYDSKIAIVDDEDWLHKWEDPSR